MRPGREIAVRGLALEAALAEVVAAMGANGVTPLLIKGPAIVRWLYDDPAERRFDDLDLLVAPSDQAAASRALAAAGFARIPTNWRATSHHATPWVRGGPPPVAVDLHTSLFFLVERDHDVVWRALSTGSRTLDVGGARISAPGPAAHALIVALHAAHHGHGAPKPLEDLRRALLRVGEDDWRAAAHLAGVLDAERPFAAGLRMLAPGAELADRLGLDARLGARLRLHLHNGPVYALAAFDRLAAAASAGDRARLVGHMLFPPADYLRTVEPQARRGSLGLALARVLRPLRLLARAPAGYAAWREVACEERGPGAGGLSTRLDAARRAWWAARALRACRDQLCNGDLAAVRLPPPPPCRSEDERGLGLALRAGRASCLERSLVRQRWHQSRGTDRDVVVGVTAPAGGFGAHAWLDGDPEDPGAFSELLRRPAPRG